MPDTRFYIPLRRRVKEPPPVVPSVVGQSPEFAGLPASQGRPLAIEELLRMAGIPSPQLETGVSDRVTAPQSQTPILTPRPRVNERLLERRRADLLRASKPESLYQKIEDVAIAPANTMVTIGPVTMKAGEWVGLFGLGIAGASAIAQSLPVAYQSLMRAATTRNINAWSLKTNTPVDPQMRAALADWIARQSKPSWLKTPQLVKEIFKPSQAGKFVPTPGATTKANQYTQAIVKRWLPEFSKSRTDDVIAGIRAGRFDPDAVAPSVQAVQAGVMELGKAPKKPTTAPVAGVTPAEVAKPTVTPEVTEAIGIRGFIEDKAVNDKLNILSEEQRNLVKGFRVNPNLRGANAAWNKVYKTIDVSSLSAARKLEPSTINHEVRHAILDDLIENNRKAVDEFARQHGQVIDWANLERLAKSYKNRPNTVTEAFSIKYEQLAESFAKSDFMPREGIALPKAEVGEPLVPEVAPVTPEVTDTLYLTRVYSGGGLSEIRPIKDTPVSESLRSRSYKNLTEAKKAAKEAGYSRISFTPNLGAQRPKAQIIELKPTLPKAAPGEPEAGLQPVTTKAPPQPLVPKAPEAEFIAKPEATAVTEVAGSPPKPPKDWDKIGGQLYDRFKKQAPDPTPTTVPLSDRLLRAKKGLEKVTTDQLARLNALGWQAEVDAAMVMASSGQSAQLYRETMKSIAKSLDNDSNLVSYVDDYLMLRHQLEVLKATGRKYFTVKKGEITQRFTATQIGLLFAQMKKELGVANYEKVKEAAAHVPAVYNQILRETDELTSGQIEGLISKYPWYNPILFVKESIPVNITRKLSPRQVRQLTSLEADKEQTSPLMSLPSTISRRMKAQAINDARKSISEAAIKPENKALIGGKVEIVDKKPEGAFIDYFDKGVHKYLKLDKGSAWLAKDIELLQTQPASMIISMVRSIQNLSKMAFTTYNPGFMVWNTAFDGMTAYFSEGIRPWGFGKTLAGNIKAIFKDVPAVNEFRKAGGEMMGFFDKVGTGEVEKAATPYVRKEKGRLVLRNPESLKRFFNPFELIRELGIAGENAARRAAYEKAIKEGLTPKEAGLRGRRVTVDFSRFSAASKHINNWFIYFNPALQGFYLPARAMIKSPRSIWRLAVLVAGFVALTFYNQSYDEYDDVRDSDKVGKLLVMLPSDEYNKFGQKVPHYLALLPMREFALFTSPVEYLMGKLRTEDPESYRTLAQEWGVLYPVISPLSMISETGGLVMPTQVASTIQQILKNHDDFRDRPIIDDEMALLPKVEQYDQWTDKMAIRIGQALGQSPKKLDFFVSNMFGAMGRDFLRTIGLAVSNIDREQVDERIAGLVTQLRDIPSTVPPSRIEVARETFLEGLSAEDREIVLNMERLSDDQIPFITSMVDRFYRRWGGQVYATAKEKALSARTLEDYPPEALEQLQKEAVLNAKNLLSNKISKYQYDQNRTRYRAYYSGQATAEWRQGMFEGATSKREVEKFMPESYKRAEEFQAVSAYNEIRSKFIDEAGGVFDAEAWNEIEQRTLGELKKFYSPAAIQYAIAHKDDWIDNLPELARQIERQRATGIEDESWWDDYREAKTPRIPSPAQRPAATPGGYVPMRRR